MSLTAEDVREILRLLEESTFDELVLETNGMKLVLQRGGGGAQSALASTASAPVERTAARPAPPASVKPDAVAPSPGEPGVVDVPAPLLGVFYRAPKPGAEPFVEIGQRVEPDTVIAIIEVMKLMNSVRAGVAGEVVAIPAKNGVMVEYGETLVRVRTDG
jgi:acetyl-CoA carboxylase biotin carboxyl carrier protein